MRKTRLTIAAVAAAVTALLVAGIGAAPANAAEKWPTQAQVTKAKKSAAASATEYKKIQGLVRVSQAAAVSAATVSLEKQNDYAAAEASLQKATAKADSLKAQAAKAQQAATTANKRFGSITSQLYLAGGNSGLTTQLLMSQGNASQLLARLSEMSRLTGLAASLRSSASQQANVASSLSAQAASAEKARTKLAGQAKTALSAAKAAQSAANTALATSQKKSKVAYQEMAELKHQSAKLQEKYAEYQAYLAALAAQRAAQGNSSSLYAVAQSITPDPAAAQAYAQSQMGRYGWDSSQFSCLVQLWTHESGWRVNAYNASSAAYGIPQAWPGSKMATYGSDWMTSYVTQINWGLDYIRSSYGTPCAAWSFELSHTPNWY
jgi:peptidoglycan DL-endopeptidase CwlO